MHINIDIKNKIFPESEVEETIRDSFKRELDVAEFKLDRYKRICKSFEDKYKMTSEEFYLNFEGGKLEEDDDFFDWYSAWRGLEVWNKKYKILTGLSL